MTRDDMYQVIYECSVCGKTRSIDDTNLARIRKEFEALGWENMETPGVDGNVDYIVFCPKCYEKEQEMMAAAFDEDMGWDAFTATYDEQLAEMREDEDERAAFMSWTR